MLELGLGLGWATTAVASPREVKIRPCLEDSVLGTASQPAGRKQIFRGEVRAAPKLVLVTLHKYTWTLAMQAWLLTAPWFFSVSKHLSELTEDQGLGCEDEQVGRGP